MSINCSSHCIGSTFEARFSRSQSAGTAHIHLGSAMPVSIRLLVVLSLMLATSSTWASQSEIDYLRQVKPLLAEKCYACHSVLNQEADLRLETLDLLLSGGESGPAIVPGDSQLSLIVERVAGDEFDRMPPADEGSRLTDEEIELLRGWIDQGAQAPNESAPDRPLDHWAFRPIEMPEIPSVDSERTPIIHPIDAFLESRRESLALKVQPVPERALLIRRLYLDLVGLPPTLEQMRESRPWGEIVDELLASPHHGERWGRHWMDIWRYSDWYGLNAQLRYSQKHLWHWRDWIVESLNADKGYDQMIHEMLAGDELAPSNPDVIRATGFLARNYYLFNRTTWLDNTIEHTSKAFLGLTLNCAKCHDHKYDPISQVDYYRFRAIFEPHQVRLDAVPGVTDFETDGLPRVFDNDLEIATYLHRRGDPKDPDSEVQITPSVPAIFADFMPAIERVKLPRAAFAPGTRSYVRKDLRLKAQRQVERARQKVIEATSETFSGDQDSATARKDVAGKGDAAQDVSPSESIARANLAVAEAELAALLANIAADDARFGLADSPGDPDLVEQLEQIAAERNAEALVLKAEARLVAETEKSDASKKMLAEAKKKLGTIAKGDYQYRSLPGARKALESPAQKEEDAAATYPEFSTGRRLALAKWMTNRNHPLTARVAVNHVWMRHFGQPLVDSVFDFGLRAPPPEHRELLDFLAATFIESGWSFRTLHRLIVTSQAYQLGSSNANADPETLKRDPNNQFYWRMNTRRMESQVVRDSLLMLADTLDTQLGGPSIDPAQKSVRRSLYFKHSRDQKDRFLKMFDDADLLQCYRRSESIIPQQALAMSNSELSLGMSEAIALRIEAQLTTGDTFVDRAFMTILGRIPDLAERNLCQKYSEKLRRLLEEKQIDQIDARINKRLVQVLLNHNDFISIR